MRRKALSAFEARKKQVDAAESREMTWARYPYVRVRIGCDQCGRFGSFRLARLAAKYGPDVSIYSVLPAITGDCRMRDVHHPAQGRCHARYIDLDPPTRPPDIPTPVMQLVEGGKASAEGNDPGKRIEGQRAAKSVRFRVAASGLDESPEPVEGSGRETKSRRPRRRRLAR